MSKNDEFQRFSVSLPRDLFEQFEEFRNKNDISRSDAVRKAMRQYLITETKQEKSLSSESITAVIILNLSHAWIGDHHNHDSLSKNEHSKAHSHDAIHNISETSYFSYEDTDLIKINHFEHMYHDIIISKLHIHAAHERCVLVIPVKGAGSRIKEFYEHIIRLRSVLSHSIILEE